MGHARPHPPDGRQLVPLRDSAGYITGLPKKEAALPEWQAEIQALLLVAAERDVPTMFARIAMMRALNRQRPKAMQAPRRKRAKAYRVIR
jgi:hypothetical protein